MCIGIELSKTQQCQETMACTPFSLFSAQQNTPPSVSGKTENRHQIKIENYMICLQEGISSLFLEAQRVNHAETSVPTQKIAMVIIIEPKSK
jgi:hypothetical protein